MSQVYTYLVVIVGLMMIFNLMGINTATGYVTNQLDVWNPDGLGLTNFYLTIAAVLAAALLTGVVIGFFTKAPTESILLTTYAEVLLLFLADILFIVNYMLTNYSGWMAYATALIMVPLAVGYGHAVISWWGGRG